MIGIDDAVAAGLQIGGKLIDRLWPDPEQAAKARLALLQLQQDGELKALLAETDLAKAQIAVNEADANSGNLFQAGWRPAVGWCCAAGVGSQFVIAPFATWAGALAGYTVVFPPLDTAVLMPLLLGMLGLVGARTYEKVQGVAK